MGISRKTAVFCVVAVLVSCVQAATAFGEDATTLDRPLWIRLRGVLLQIPRGYVVGWPQPNAKENPIRSDNISFTFWMPDLRFVEIPDSSIIGARPQEKGRTKPLDAAFVVRVIGLEKIHLGETGYVSPQMSFSNLTSPQTSSTGYEFINEGFGLIRFRERNWPHQKPRPFVNYVHIEDSDPQIILRCTPSDQQVSLPLCDGKVHFAASDLAFRVRFPKEALPQWKEIVTAVRQLFNGWKAQD